MIFLTLKWASQPNVDTHPPVDRAFAPQKIDRLGPSGTARASALEPVLVQQQLLSLLSVHVHVNVADTQLVAGGERPLGDEADTRGVAARDEHVGLTRMVE